MSFPRALLVVLSAISMVALSSCDTNPVSPGTSGNLLRATIDGTTTTFVLAEQRYDAQIQYSFVSGVSTSSKTLTITFTSDVTAGTFPRSLARNDINIIYIEKVGGQDVVYDCLSNNDERAMTLTRSSGGIVEGTFSGTPSIRTDATKHVTITGGEFSVTLP